MTENHDAGLGFWPLLDTWTELAPDPQAMEQVTALMLAGVRQTQHQEMTEPGEVHFRLLTYVWACVACGAYLGRNRLMEWFAANPILTGSLIVCGCLCLLAPLLLLLPALFTADERSSSTC